MGYLIGSSKISRDGNIGSLFNEISLGIENLNALMKL